MGCYHAMIAHINHFFIALLALCIVPVAFHYYTVHGMVSIKVSTELYISGFVDLTLVCEVNMLYMCINTWPGKCIKVYLHCG